MCVMLRLHIDVRALMHCAYQGKVEAKLRQSQAPMKTINLIASVHAALLQHYLSPQLCAATTAILSVDCAACGASFNNYGVHASVSPIQVRQLNSIHIKSAALTCEALATTAHDAVQSSSSLSAAVTATAAHQQAAASLFLQAVAPAYKSSTRIRLWFSMQLYTVSYIHQAAQLAVSPADAI
eukprot:3009-Heterococcus_DN1.PRE.3